jgi:endogenous inhibitor of DNA gyrase (YacG/DUF329 family)
MPTFKKVLCPNCGRTVLHYIEESGTDSIYRTVCQRCNNVIVVYSAGQTALAKQVSASISIELNIKL